MRYAALLACVALWGCVFVGVHELLPELDAVQMVTLRFLAVAALFGALIAANPAWRPHLARREWVTAAVAGVLAVPVCQLAIVEGQRYLSPPIASLVVTFSPAIAAVLAIRTERLTTRQAAGFAIALGGVGVIVVLGAGSGAELSASDPLKASVALLTPASWALYTIISRPLAREHGAVGSVAVAMIAGAVTLLPLLPHALDGARDLSAHGWLWLAYLVTGGTTLPYIFWAVGLRGLPVNRTAAFMYMIPCFAMGWTALFLGDAPSGLALAGGAVVLAGVALTQSAPQRPPGGGGDQAGQQRLHQAAGDEDREPVVDGLAPRHAG
jgi:drug/metabolite transporter (DMT)-like permease